MIGRDRAHGEEPGIHADDVPREMFDYWLSESHQFLVDCPDCDLGVVDDVICREDGAVKELLVAVGPFGRELISVPAEEVVLVNPIGRRLLLRRAPREMSQPSKVRSLFRLPRR